ncbi:MAG: hypothetical protein Q9171_001497 [Xanthocarpia ochracea]
MYIGVNFDSDQSHQYPQTQRSFSIISDHYEPSISRGWINKLPSYSLCHKKTQLLVLLVTPSYLKILGEGDRFIPDLLRQTYGGWAKGQTLDVLVAVVDRICSPANQITHADTVTIHRGEKVSYSGKGISALLVDSETAAPDLWSHLESGREGAISIRQQRSTLSFQFGPNKELVDETLTAKSFQSKTIRLPVANTVFHNGRESTIQAQRWIVGETILEPTLACVKRRWLHEQVLRIGFPYPQKPDHYPLHVTIPIVCLTHRQRVATSMGNIIRQLHSMEDASEAGHFVFQTEAEPASKQLENAVAEWITEPGNETKAVEVWALVRPPTVLQTFRLPFFSDLVKAGGHFHKVLSGGGGWGNKQGLLALDPEVDFDVTPEFSMAQTLGNGGPEPEGSNVSGQIVNPGDVVQFFAHKPIESSAKTFPTAAGSLTLSCPPCIVFGTTASTVDAMPEPSSTTPRAPSSSDCIFVHRHFGMLSEQGVSLTTVSIDGEVSRTKIDVPHAVLSCGIHSQFVHSSPTQYEPSAQSISSHNSQQSLKADLTYRRLRIDNPSAAVPDPKFEYLGGESPTPEPADQIGGLALAKAVAPARIRKVKTVARPKRRTTPRKNPAEDPASKKFGAN